MWASDWHPWCMLSNHFFVIFLVTFSLKLPSCQLPSASSNDGWFTFRFYCWLDLSSGEGATCFSWKSSLGKVRSNLFSFSFCPEVSIHIGFFPVDEGVVDIILMSFEVFSCQCKWQYVDLMVNCLNNVPTCLAWVNSIIMKYSAQCTSAIKSHCNTTRGYAIDDTDEVYCDKKAQNIWIQKMGLPYHPWNFVSVVTGGCHWGLSLELLLGLSLGGALGTSLWLSPGQ